MPPFQYRTVRDPYVGSITNLMGAGPRARAQSIREVGDIRAEEAREKGAITSQMIGSLGRIAGEGYESHQEAKADQIYNDLIKTVNEETIQALDRTDQALPPQAVMDTMGGSSTGVEPFEPSLTATTPEPYEPRTVPPLEEDAQDAQEWKRNPDGSFDVSLSYDNAGGSPPLDQTDQVLPPPAVMDTMGGRGTGRNEPPPPMPDQAWPGVLGDITEGQRADRGRLFTHITDDGRHDITTLRSALIEKGVPPTQVRRLLSQASERNEAITQFNEANAKENAREEDIRHDRNLIVLYETYGDHPTQSQFIQVLGRKRGMEDYTKYLNLENASSVLRQAQRENLPSVLRSIVAGVIGLYGTERARSGAFAAVIDRYRADLGEDLAQSLIEGGIDGLEATIKSQLAVIDPQVREDPKPAVTQLAIARRAYTEAARKYGPDSEQAQSLAETVKTIEQTMVDDATRLRAPGKPPKEETWITRAKFEAETKKERMIDAINRASLLTADHDKGRVLLAAGLIDEGEGYNSELESLDALRTRFLRAHESMISRLDAYSSVPGSVASPAPRPEVDPLDPLSLRN
jgi:hypothetical protein